ncbi:MAG: PAS domain S-box protein [Pseudomonadota bacterium]
MLGDAHELKNQILIVEKDAFMAADLERRLKGLGYSIHGKATTGEEALELVKRRRPDLVLLAIALPGEMDGLAAAGRITDEWDIPVVLLADQSDAGRLENLAAPCRFGYMVKPFRDWEPRLTLERTLHEAKVNSELRAALGLLVEQKLHPRKNLQAAKDGFRVINKEGKFTDVNEAHGAVSGSSREEIPRLNVADLDADGKPEKMGLILAHLNTGLTLIDSSLTIAWVNETVRKMFPKGDPLGRRCHHFFEDSPNPCNFCGALSTFHDGKTHIVERYNSDVHRWFRIISHPIANDDGRVVQVMESISDITDSKLAGETLRESHDLLKSTQRLAKVGGWEWDLERRTMTWTDETYRIHGYEPGMLTAGSPEHIKHSLACYDPRDRPVIEAAFRRCAEEGEPYNLEFTITTAQGRRACIQTMARPLVKDRRIVKVLGNIMDITDRKLAEEALRESRRRLKLILDTAPALIWQKDNSGKYLTANKAYCSTVGLSEKDIIGKTDHDLFPQAIADQYVNDDRTVLTSGVAKLGVEEHHRKSSGELGWSLTNKMAYCDADGNVTGTIGFALDITDRKRSEDALEAAYLKLESLWNITSLKGADLKKVSDHILDSIARMTNSEYGFYGFVNEDESLMTIHSWSGEAMRDCSMVDKPQCFPIAQAGVWGEAVRHRKPFILNSYTIDHPAGKGLPEGHVSLFNLLVVPFFVEGRISSVAAVANRIGGYSDEEVLQITSFLSGIQALSDSKRAEEALRESEERLRLAHKATNDVVWDWDIVSDSQGWNEAGAVVFGWTDIVERPQTAAWWADRVHPDDRRRVEDGFLAVVNNPAMNHWRDEYRFRKADGTHAIVLDHGFVLRDKQGKALRMIGAKLDITDRKHAEEEKAILQAQLQQAHKMEAVGALAGGIAHDFNNLLQAITGHTQILLMEKSPDDDDHSSLTAIQEAGNHAAELVRQLLFFSRKADSRRRPVDLNQEVELAGRMLERTIPKMVDIDLRLGSRLWAINADPVQIEQIMLNLGTNAADAMPNGGKLFITTNNTILNEACILNEMGAQPGRYVLLTVSDTGEGMDRATVEKIFDPFFTTKEIGKGTGLGLASVYGIVKSHGGCINCQSAVGQGTTFRIYLPALEQVEDYPARDVAAKPPQGGSETILVVDDEASIRDMALQILKKVGYQVLAASSGEEALDIFSAKSADIGLVVMDLGMPGMGGYNCLRELLRRDPEAKVIIASGYSPHDQVKKSLEAGAMSCVGKPYQLDVLLDVVRTVLDGAR